MCAILNSDELNRLEHAPQRVVSLVPSATESLFDLGFGERLIGISDYCIHPSDRLEKLARVGGTKTPRVAEIAAMKPDLVIVNQEENDRESIEALSALGLTLWMSFPMTARQVIEDWTAFAALMRSDTSLLQMRLLENALELAEQARGTLPEWRYFSPIWEQIQTEGTQWWMTFNDRTYSSDILSLFGGVNVFGERDRRYPLEADLGVGEAENPGERDTRYPRVCLEEVRSAMPDVILLPSEPYEFSEDDRGRLSDLLGGGRVVHTRCLDGTLLTWCGTRLGRSLAMLPELLDFPR